MLKIFTKNSALLFCRGLQKSKRIWSVPRFAFSDIPSNRQPQKQWTLNQQNSNHNQNQNHNKAKNNKSWNSRPNQGKTHKKQKQEQQFIYGLNSVEAALHSKRRQFFELYISDSEVIELNSKTMKILQYAKSKEIPVKYLAKERLDRMMHGTGSSLMSSPHQNVILKCSKLKFVDMGKYLAAEQSQKQQQSQKNPKSLKDLPSGVYIYTDKITDPQNFGSIVRSCLYFGVKMIFTSKKNHCPLNPTVSKVSSGAIEMIDVGMVSNSEAFLKAWKEDTEEGFVMSTEVVSQNQPSVGRGDSWQQNRKMISVQELKDLKQRDNLDLNRCKILVIMGSEGHGVSQHLRKYSDYNILIDRKGSKQYPYCLIDSLNVNAAMTAILFELTK